MKRCCIFAAGKLSEKEVRLRGDELIIAADAGYENLKSMGIIPHLAIGDFDSAEAVPTDTEVVKYPKEKDDTDTLLAVKEAISRGSGEIVIYGSLGGRIDHTFANIQTLLFIAQNGSRGYLVGQGWVITAVKDGSIRFASEKSGTVSVFCAGDKASGVNIKGLKYEVENAELRNDFPVGVSNEFIGKEAEISVKSGVILVMWQESGY